MRGSGRAYPRAVAFESRRGYALAVIRQKLASLVIVLGASAATMVFAAQAGSAVDASTTPALYKHELQQEVSHGWAGSAREIGLGAVTR
jgi:hypothetical protein